MSEIVSSLFLVGGGFFAMIAGVGLVRFRDLPSRMHAATKASGAALLLVLVAVCVRQPGWDVWIKAAVTLGFGFLTLPVAAHLLGRSAMMPGGERSSGDQNGPKAVAENETADGDPSPAAAGDD